MLAKNLLSMQKYFPREYSFFPKTWLLPGDFKAFKDQFNERKAKTFIIKPENSSQGKGIFLTRNYDWFNPNEHYVAQRYLHKPYLIDGLKFDLRIYVLLTSVTPLRIFIYKEGLARFATNQYTPPTGSNLQNMCMHLTNYAINKDSTKFKQATSNSDEKAHKRTMTSVLAHIDQCMQPEVQSGSQCWQQIQELTVKTVIACHQPIAHQFRSNKPQDVETNLCFQVLGIDIFLDRKAKPWLIEVNQSPSFATDSPLDQSIKQGVLADAFKILNLTPMRKQAYLEQHRKEMHQRLIGG